MQKIRRIWLVVLSGVILLCGCSHKEGVAKETVLESETNPKTYKEKSVNLKDEDKRKNSEASSNTEDWVANLSVAQRTNQLIVVAANGTSATISMHVKDEKGNWTQILSTNGFVGRDGVGQASEYSACTPQGVWGFCQAFGNAPNPGTGLSYIQVDDSYYWVDDVNSAYYNKFVSTREVTTDWNSAEHITACGSAYNYVLALDYNAACVPGSGSAFFLHCSEGKPTSGCISVPENTMIQIMQQVQPGCLIIIDTAQGVYNY